MLEKGFLRNKTTGKPKHQEIVQNISKSLLYLGVVVLLGSLGYLLVNWEKSNLLIGMLVPFLVAGLGLILVSRLIQRAYKKLHN